MVARLEITCIAKNAVYTLEKSLCSLANLPAFLLAACFCISCGTNKYATSKGSEIDPIVKGAIPVLLSDQFSFTEGPAADKAGNVYFTDQPNDKIWKYDLNGNLTLFKEGAGRSNGLFFDKKDRLYSCADANDQLWRFGNDNTVDTLVKNYEGKKLNGPNDLWIHPNGDIYFTDPYYQRDYWTRKKPEIEQQRVYVLKKNSASLQIADSTLVKPNGIIGSHDGSLLYVADIGAGKTYRYHIEKDGSLSQKTLFVEMGSDGMTTDKAGNIYLTGKGVTIFNKDGKQIGHIPIDQSWTANVCFGGAEHNVLFITASKALYKINMAVKGY